MGIDLILKSPIAFVILSRNQLLETGKTAPSVKCLLYRHEGLSWIPRIHILQTRQGGRYLSFLHGKVETPGGSLVSSPRLLDMFQASKRPCLKRARQMMLEGYPGLTFFTPYSYTLSLSLYLSPPHTHAWSQTHSCISTC